MAVIVRDTVEIRGKKYDNVKVYKSTSPVVTPEAERKADALDVLLSQKMSEIQSEMRKLGLLKMRGKPGVLRLWWEVGKRLEFVDHVDVEPEADRHFAWSALYDHAGELRPSEPGQRASEIVRNHFRQCYQLSKLDWETVQSARTWSAWKDFFENKRVNADSRIVDWLVEKSKRGPKASIKNWLRKLTRAVNSHFLTRDTAVLTDEELAEELDEIYTRVLEQA